MRFLYVIAVLVAGQVGPAGAADLLWEIEGKYASCHSKSVCAASDESWSMSIKRLSVDTARVSLNSLVKFSATEAYSCDVTGIAKLEGSRLVLVKPESPEGISEPVALAISNESIRVEYEKRWGSAEGSYCGYKADLGGIEARRPKRK